MGFIEDLPSTLVAAFRSTLEELEEADLLLHVLDVSDPSYREHERAVHKVLHDLGLEDRPIMRVWNKADRVSPIRLSEHLEEEEGWAVSALDGSGCDVLLEQMESALFASKRRYTRDPKRSA